ncbi:fibrinogen like 1B [Brienomyrus brachyistius]|uniref:fibrinogen like 1B n=1 Tax=Brienomyrus brachyistius TaxID=42636 RepID=UPI0020B2407C|nr:fibrinogen like 1B [Brienomyrus brachyistius]
MTVTKEINMKTVFATLLLFLLRRVSASYRFSPEEECHRELQELRSSIGSLESRLLIGEWQLRNLREHNYFYRPSTEHSSSPPNLNKTTKSAVLKTTALPSTSGNLIVYDRDCSTLYNRVQLPSGFYRIRPRSDMEPFLVYCDMTNGGGWTVIQRRRNGKVDFNRDWEEYKSGFGHFKERNDEFWLGNEHIYTLLKEGENLMRIDLMDWSGQRTYAFYENFRISDEKDKYRLHFGLYNGKAGDALSGGSHMKDQWSISHNGMPFSTRDRDHDRYLQGSCAKENKGGWWYNRCHAANLNGKFYRSGEYKGTHDNGMVWLTWRGLWYSLRHTSMKVRPLLFMDSLGSGAGPGE